MVNPFKVVVASVAILVSLCLSIPAAGAVGTHTAKEQLARVASQELSFAMPGVYVHGVALHANTMAWISFKPRGFSRYGNDIGSNHLFVSGIRSFHPEMLKTAPKRTIVQVALSGSWIVWEAQPPICYLGAPRCGMAPRKRLALKRHGCGGAAEFQPWFIYAQNLNTRQRVFVDSSFHEEWRNTYPGSVTVLHVHGDTVMWGATHSAHCPKCVFTYRLLTKQLPNSGIRPLGISSYPKESSTSSPCTRAWISGQNGEVEWGCVRGAIAGTKSHAMPAKVQSAGAASNFGYADAEISSNMAFNMYRLALDDLATGTTTSLETSTSVHTPTLSNGLIMWLGVGRHNHQALKVRELTTGFTTVLASSKNGMLEQYDYADYNTTFVYPTSSGPGMHPVTYLHVDTLR